MAVVSGKQIRLELLESLIADIMIAIRTRARRRMPRKEPPRNSQVSHTAGLTTLTINLVVLFPASSFSLMAALLLVRQCFWVTTTLTNRLWTKANIIIMLALRILIGTSILRTSVLLPMGFTPNQTAAALLMSLLHSHAATSLCEAERQLISVC
jgi:hypothetical protein